jgi:hypothetical protein
MTYVVSLPRLSRVWRMKGTVTYRCLRLATLFPFAGAAFFFAAVFVRLAAVLAGLGRAVDLDAFALVVLDAALPAGLGGLVVLVGFGAGCLAWLPLPALADLDGDPAAGRGAARGAAMAVGSACIRTRSNPSEIGRYVQISPALTL